MNIQSLSLHPDFCWLTEAYVRANAWYPVSHLVREENPRYMYHRMWGKLPCKSITEYRSGDIIIFNVYDEEMPYDRFRTISQQDIDDLFSGPPSNAPIKTKEEFIASLFETTRLLPVGVVVHQPGIVENLDSLEMSLLLAKI